MLKCIIPQKVTHARSGETNRQNLPVNHLVQSQQWSRTLVEQLARVNPIHLSSNEKLAFWINLYNALIMHAYLAYGVPRNDSKLFSLMQKAAYTVGGHSYNAAAIEYVVLKMKPPLHRPQIVRIFTAKNVREEPQEAQNDFIRASVGVSSNGISHSLPPLQAAFVSQLWHSSL